MINRNMQAPLGVRADAARDGPANPGHYHRFAEGVPGGTSQPALCQQAPTQYQRIGTADGLARLDVKPNDKTSVAGMYS
jgi:hypothetical protein